jgi:excisionase family DNA binding protein
MSEPWVSVDEVSGHLGVAKDTIYRWIEARDLPAHRVGRLWKFKLSEVDAWVQRGGADDSQRSSSSSKKGKKSK